MHVCVCLESIWRSFDNLYVSVSVEVYMNIQGCDLSRTYIYLNLFMCISRVHVLIKDCVSTCSSLRSSTNKALTFRVKLCRNEKERVKCYNMKGEGMKKQKKLSVISSPI